MRGESRRAASIGGGGQDAKYLLENLSFCRIIKDIGGENEYIKCFWLDFDFNYFGVNN